MCGPRQQLPMWCRDTKSLGKKGFKGKQKLRIDSPFLCTSLIATILSISSSFPFCKYIAAVEFLMSYKMHRYVDCYAWHSPKGRQHLYKSSISFYPGELVIDVEASL